MKLVFLSPLLPGSRLLPARIFIPGRGSDTKNCNYRVFKEGGASTFFVVVKMNFLLKGFSFWNAEDFFFLLVLLLLDLIWYLLPSVYEVEWKMESETKAGLVFPFKYLRERTRWSFVLFLLFYFGRGKGGWSELFINFGWKFKFWCTSSREMIKKFSLILDGSLKLYCSLIFILFRNIFISILMYVFQMQLQWMQVS